MNFFETIFFHECSTIKTTTCRTQELSKNTIESDQFCKLVKFKKLKHLKIYIQNIQYCYVRPVD